MTIEVKEPIVLVLNEDQAKAMLKFTGKHSINATMAKGLNEKHAREIEDLYFILEAILNKRGLL